MFKHSLLQNAREKTFKVEKFILALSNQLQKLTEAISCLKALQANQPPIPIENKLLLTLKEVQALTGLGRETLRDAIASNQRQLQIKPSFVIIPTVIFFAVHDAIAFYNSVFPSLQMRDFVVVVLV